VTGRSCLEQRPSFPSVLHSACANWRGARSWSLERKRARLYAAVRLYVNFFQPSFKLKEKRREGAKLIKRYDDPSTPYQRALAHPMVAEAVKERLRAQYRVLDPVTQAEIRSGKEELGNRIDRRAGRAPSGCCCKKRWGREQLNHEAYCIRPKPLPLHRLVLPPGFRLQFSLDNTAGATSVSQSQICKPIDTPEMD
jgi:hypothetical protein